MDAQTGTPQLEGEGNPPFTAEQLAWIDRLLAARQATAGGRENSLVAVETSGQLPANRTPASQPGTLIQSEESSIQVMLEKDIAWLRGNLPPRDDTNFIEL